MSPLPVGRRPLGKPREKTPYSVAPTPSSASVGKMRASGPRETKEYSICRSTMGWTFAARATVSALTSESPMWRT